VIQRLRFSQIFALLSLAYMTDSSAQQSTSGYCSPAIENVTGNVVTNCYTTITALRKGIEDNLTDTIAAVQQLLVTQRYYMFPSLDDYIANPSPETWKAARRDVDLVTQRVTMATVAAIAYDAGLEPQLGPGLKGLHDALRSRGGLLSRLPSEPPPVAFMSEWISKYREQVAKLQAELSALQKNLKNSSFKPG
jgi:hypothetical protein